MNYKPLNPPSDAKDLPAFLMQELQRISDAGVSAVDLMKLSVQHRAPKKYGDGTLVLADGTDWNPGSGGGVYCYRAGAWRFLG